METLARNEIVYLESGDLALFDGNKYRRDKKTGYYLCSAKRKRLHRAVWEYYNGEIPQGFHIHHKDSDKSNNEPENLELKSGHAHRTHHGLERAALHYDDMCNNLLENAMPKAKRWHSTKAGRDWHSEHAKAIMADRKPIKRVCEQCGSDFESIHLGNTRFCSNNCKSAYRRKQGYDNVSRACSCCGELFVTNKYSKTQTCSRSCANTLRARNRKTA